MTKNKRRFRRHLRHTRRVKWLPVETILLRRGAISQEEFERWHQRFTNMWRRPQRISFPKDTDISTANLQMYYLRSQEYWKNSMEVTNS